MPKKPKSGPPYTDIPKEVYVVVTNPFGMNATPRSRDQGDFNRVASWAQVVLKQAGLGEGRIATIECIYSMGTRDEVILQFQEGSDIIPLLGEHRWANIFQDGKGSPHDPRSTRVFIYNWRNNGDPANHNWSENYPEPLSLDSVPVKSPYPTPSWIRPPSTLTNFVYPIPHPPIPPPVPNHELNASREQQPTTLPPPSTVTPSPTPSERQDQQESREQPMAQDSSSAELFRPYEPPSQHPSHGQFVNWQPIRSDEPSLSDTPPPSPKFTKKLDPYELDEEALNALRSPDPSQEGIKNVKYEDIQPIPPLFVKAELTEGKTKDRDAQYNIATRLDSRYKPSQALVDAFNSLSQPEQGPSTSLPTYDIRRRHNADLASQAAPPLPASSGYQPSAELEAEISSFLLGTATTVSPLSSSGGARPRSSPVVVIKREYEEDVATSLVGERKRIKVEEC